MRPKTKSDHASNHQYLALLLVLLSSGFQRARAGYVFTGVPAGARYANTLPGLRSRWAINRSIPSRPLRSAHKTASGNDLRPRTPRSRGRGQGIPPFAKRRCAPAISSLPPSTCRRRSRSIPISCKPTTTSARATLQLNAVRKRRDRVPESDRSGRKDSGELSQSGSSPLPSPPLSGSGNCRPTGAAAQIRSAAPRDTRSAGFSPPRAAARLKPKSCCASPSPSIADARLPLAQVLLNRGATGSSCTELRAYLKSPGANQARKKRRCRYWLNRR